MTRSTALAVILILAPISFGQSATAQTTFSLVGGVNRTSMSLDLDVAPLVPDIETTRNRYLGLEVLFPVSESFGIAHRAGYSGKGTSVTATESGFTATADFQLGYFETALLAKRALGRRGGTLGAHVVVGPTLALLASCRTITQVEHEGISVEEELDCEEAGLEPRDFDLGLAGGGGIDLRLSRRVGLSVGVLYTVGLADIDTDNQATTRNRALSFLAGISLTTR